MLGSEVEGDYPLQDGLFRRVRVEEDVEVVTRLLETTVWGRQ